MGRGIVEAQTLRAEQFELEARTSDPGDAQPGEYWIRTDQTSTNPDVIAELRRQDTSGVTTCPIFAAAEESNLGADVTRGPSVILDDGSVGFVAMTTGEGAVGSPRAVDASGTQYVSHNALELGPILDTTAQRLDDQTSSSLTSKRGVKFIVNADFGEVGYKISQNTSGFTTSYLYDFAQSTIVETKDVSGLTSLDTFSISHSYVGGREYGILLDNGGSSYTVGLEGTGETPTISTTDIDLVNAIKDTNDTSAGSYQNILAVGNPDGVLD